MRLSGIFRICDEQRSAGWHCWKSSGLATIGVENNNRLAISGAQLCLLCMISCMQVHLDNVRVLWCQVCLINLAGEMVASFFTGYIIQCTCLVLGKGGSLLCLYIAKRNFKNQSLSQPKHTFGMAICIYSRV